MTVYKTPSGREVIVCDGCGVAKDGGRPTPEQLAAMTKVDHTAAILEAGAPAGTVLNVADYCPRCRDIERAVH